MTQRSQPQVQPRREQELELLSAYLDNQLSAAERVNLERRLTAEPQLQRELDELRATVASLQALDPVPLPRSFTLDPAKVARPRGFLPLSWVMQLGSGLAGFALVLLASLQLFSAGALPVATMSSAAATSAPAAEAASMAAEAAPMPYPEASRKDPTAAPAATSAPAAMSLPTEAAAAAQAPAVSEAAGGLDSGPQSNSPAPVDMGDAAAGAAPSAADQMAAPSIQSSGSSSPGTLESALEPGSRQASQPAGPVGLNPGITLALGVLLIALALGWNLATRRRV